MPELPEVETARCIAHDELVGKTLESLTYPKQYNEGYDAIIFCEGHAALKKLCSTAKGSKVVGTGRHGKYFWISILPSQYVKNPEKHKDKTCHIVLHFGMTGYLRSRDGKEAHYRRGKNADDSLWPPKFWKLSFKTTDGQDLMIGDGRRLARIRFLEGVEAPYAVPRAKPGDEMDVECKGSPEVPLPIPCLQKMGIDALAQLSRLATYHATKGAPKQRHRKEQGMLIKRILCARPSDIREGIIERGHASFSIPTPLSTQLDWAIDQKPKRKTDLKTALLDQHVLAGLGNYMVDEICYHAKIHPGKQVPDLTDKEFETLYESIVGITTKCVANDADYRKYPKQWLFHRRWGKNKDAVDHKGNPVVFDEFGGRTTAYVPAVQGVIKSKPKKTKSSDEKAGAKSSGAKKSKAVKKGKVAKASKATKKTVAKKGKGAKKAVAKKKLVGKVKKVLTRGNPKRGSKK